MKIRITCFGLVSEVIDIQEIEVPKNGSINDLRIQLVKHYPALKNTLLKFGVDTEIVAEDYLIQPQDTIAVFPPFSGG